MKLVPLHLVLLLSWLLTACSAAPYTDIDSAELNDLLKQGVPLFDVRRPEEWRETGVVAGSRLLTYVDRYSRLMPGFLETLNVEVDRQEPLILICRTGSRTARLARKLMLEMGYRRVYNVRDGITRWIAEGRAVSPP
jgi:rhodanese-related sulfurtransferase